MTLDLNCAKFYDENKGKLNFPPKGAKKYSSSVDRKSVKTIIRTMEDSEKLVLTAYDGGLVKEDNEMTH
jgi:hypothetical protein